MFTKAIARIPGKSMVKGITNADLGVPDYDLDMSEFGKLDGGLSCLSLRF